MVCGKAAREVAWRVGRAGDGLPRLEDADDWLSPDERRGRPPARIEKRQRDWLLGRLNLKALVAEVIAARYGVRVAPAALTIARGPTGAPELRLGTAVPRPGPASGIAALAIANSHSDGLAAGAALWLDGVREAGWDAAVGIDLERVAPRSPGLLRDFLTPDEQRHCAGAGGAEADLRATMVWSAKESALKVLGLGLSADTWWLTCLPCGEEGPSWPEPAARADGVECTPAGDGWSRFTVACDPRLRAAHVRFTGWWRVLDGFVLSVAVGIWPLADAYA